MECVACSQITLKSIKSILFILVYSYFFFCLYVWTVLHFSTSVLFFQGKLEIITGGSASTMQLQLFNGDKLIGQLDDDDALLGSYPIENEMRIHVVDQFQNFVGIESSMAKFELSDKQYDERRNTVRDYLKTHHLGKYNEAEMKTLEERKKQELCEQEQKAESIKIGDRCLVTRGARRVGTVRYIGAFHLKPGIFIGVEFDEPLGMNDGR